MESRQKTFSARYADPRHDEGRYIDVGGRCLRCGCSHDLPDRGRLRAEWQSLVYHQEEPFGSTSIFAEWNVFKLARETGVKVTLDGQGGDELWPATWASCRCGCATWSRVAIWRGFLRLLPKVGAPSLGPGTTLALRSFD